MIVHVGTDNLKETCELVRNTCSEKLKYLTVHVYILLEAVVTEGFSIGEFSEVRQIKNPSMFCIVLHMHSILVSPN